MEKLFYFNFIKFTARCIYFVHILTKILEVISVHHYDLFLPNFGGHDSTADSLKLSGLAYIFSQFNCFLYFGLNLRHIWMPDIHCGKQIKLSKTMGSQLDTMGEIISSRCP